MSEPLPPTSNAGELSFSDQDPSIYAGDPSGTIAEFSEHQRQEIAGRMAPGQYNLQGNMVLENGDTLEAQCNKNYAYLNGRGISMQQFAGTLQTFRDTCQATESLVNIQRADGGKEKYGYQEVRMLGMRNPVTGEQPGLHTESVIWVTPSSTAQSTPTQDYLRTPVGINDVEVEVAQYGVFGATKGEDIPGSCRAQQILERLAATETGQHILAAQGIGFEEPAEPIALMAEVQENVDLVEEGVAVTQELEYIIGDLFQGTNKNYWQVVNVGNGTKKHTFNLLLKFPNETKYILTITKPKKGISEYRVDEMHAFGGPFFKHASFGWRAGEQAKTGDNFTEVAKPEELARMKTEISKASKDFMAESQQRLASQGKRGLGRLSIFGRSH